MMRVYMHRICIDDPFTSIQQKWEQKSNISTAQLIARYLMKFTMHFPCPCTSGIVLHAEALRPGEVLGSRPGLVYHDWSDKTTSLDTTVPKMVWDLEVMRVHTQLRQTSAEPMALPSGWNAGLAIPLFIGWFCCPFHGGFQSIGVPPVIIHF